MTGVTEQETFSGIEIRVLELLANGERNTSIARHLKVSEQAVEVMTWSLRERLNARNLMHLVIIALRRGLVSSIRDRKTTVFVTA